MSKQNYTINKRTIINSLALIMFVIRSIFLVVINMARAKKIYVEINNIITIKYCFNSWEYKKNKKYQNYN